MISDADLVDIITALYDPQPGYFSHIETTAGVTWGLRDQGFDQVIVCRGSVTLEDWLRDLESEAARIIPGYPSVGHVPYGFGAGILDAYKAISSVVFAQNASYVVGHSLGAAHAAILAGMLVADGRPVKRLLVCGCPRPGMAHLSTLLSETPISSFRNGPDPVCSVPVPLPPLLEWRHVVPPRRITVAPTDSNWHGLPAESPLAFHNIQLYRSGVRSL